MRATTVKENVPDAAVVSFALASLIQYISLGYLKVPQCYWILRGLDSDSLEVGANSEERSAREQDLHHYTCCSDDGDVRVGSPKKPSDDDVVIIMMLSGL